MHLVKTIYRKILIYLLEVSNLPPLIQFRKFNGKNVLCVFAALLIAFLIAVPASSVEFKPFLDTSSTILWKPAKQKEKVAILPGDELKISFGYSIPAKTDNVYIRMFVGKYDLNSGSIIPIIDKHEYVSSDGKTTVWRNYTVKVPYTNKLVLSAEIFHPWDFNGLNNNISLEIPIWMDLEIIDVSVPTNVVESESVLPVKVKIRSNNFGPGCVLYVEDLTTNKLVAKKHFEITKPEMTISLDVKVPEASKSEEIHIWRIGLSTVDYNEENNEKIVTLTVRSNKQFTIPGFEVLAAILAAVIALNFVRR